MTNTWPIARGTVSEREAFALAVTVLLTMFAGDAVPNTTTWYGAATIWAIEAAWGISVVVRARPPLTRTPRALWFFLAWCLVSVAWSHWRPATLASIVAQVVCALVAFAIASTLSWRRILDAASTAFRWVVGLSLVFEAVVAVVVRHPIAPIWTDYGDRDIPDAFYFSRAELFTGGRIQGLPGNANLLAMVALLAAIAVAVQLVDGRMRRGRAVAWLVVAAATLLLTRSSTVFLAVVAVVVALLVALWIRRVPSGRRGPRVLAVVAGLVVLVVAAVAARVPLLALLGRSSDLTGRGTIWTAVVGLAEQHPVLGWGWIGYWWPNIPMLAELAPRNGVQYLQAHDAALDVWMQTGLVGLALFLVYVLTTFGRSWSGAVRESYGPGLVQRPFDPVSLFPLLVVVALLVQALAESRLLYQGNWVLFALVAIKTRIVLVNEEPPSTGDGPRTPLAQRAFRATSG
ncbi:MULTISPECIES: O-antigen ligase family protein [unclassified Curtobacterium]|uniref:O-antigen ligase family protein n=1 Tax=unclassified Curtobacterium TaxID=257496 RepID=UPI0009DE451A|nr:MULTISPECIES: O-antigen ligase family protein [unclassified Curtobacterium]MBP1302435.1 O-antigen ligase [Curtobacterium sp. 1310]MDT0211822.1 O-antigen ligase family protein [Curtobacterium sp. BRD11]